MSFCTPPSRGTQRRITHRSLSKSSKAVKTPFKSPVRQDKSTTEKEGGTEEKLRHEICALRQQEKELDTEIVKLVEEGYKEEELEQHISQLHDYNEIKDVGQMIIGRIAMEIGTTTKEIYQRYALNLDD